MVGVVIADLAPLSLFALACAAGAALILLRYLVKRPPLSGATKVWLLIGLGVLPISSALAGNIQGFETTKEQKVCNSCHVMNEHIADSIDPKSMSLASRHSRNKLFGVENCFMCHQDYGMYGTVTTKMGGMKHVWMYYTKYINIPISESKKTIHIYEPYPNASCMQCHSTKLEDWERVVEHHGLLEQVRANKVACASGGCHGFGHPFTKTPEELANASVTWRDGKSHPPVLRGPLPPAPSSLPSAGAPR